MKTYLLFLLVTVYSCQLSAQNTLIPDENFEQVLIDLGLDTGTVNGFVPTANIDTVTSLILPPGGSYNRIQDLTGIESFIELVHLECKDNSLWSINISQNTKLTYLDLHENHIDNLDVSQHTTLTYLNCSTNRLTSLNISQNTGLTHLNCGDQGANYKFKSLDVSQNTELGYC